MKVIGSKSRSHCLHMLIFGLQHASFMAFTNNKLSQSQNIGLKVKILVKVT